MENFSAASQFLASCARQRMLIMGDLMVDRYLWGSIDRISPEAPVPVVEVMREEERLGGAGNVARNIIALGAEVSLFGVCGEDSQGESLRSLVVAEGFSKDGLMIESDRKTTCKTRVLAQHQQVLRIDRETVSEITAATQSALLSAFTKALPGASGVVLQDYDKGVFSKKLIQQLIQTASASGVVLCVDPKFRHFFDYAGCTLFKPNWREFATAMGLATHSMPSIEEMVVLVGQLRERMPHQQTLLTLGAEGMLWVGEAGAHHHIRGHRREVADVSGAGDSVIAMMALGLSVGLSPVLAAQYANLAGGLVCEEAGVVPVRPERWLSETTSLVSA